MRTDCQPTPFFFTGTGPIVVQLGDEAGHVLTDEAGRRLVPDPKITPNLTDENANYASDETGRTFEPDLPGA